MFLWDLIYRRFGKRTQALIILVPLAFLVLWAVTEVTIRAVF